jgi:hypothetical protein
MGVSLRNQKHHANKGLGGEMSFLPKPASPIDELHCCPVFIKQQLCAGELSQGHLRMRQYRFRP